MDEILSRCGYRCDLCVIYRPNRPTDPAALLELSEGFARYFGFSTPPERLLCDGCRTTDGILIDDECPVRPCVMALGLDHCAQCGGLDQGCDRLQERLVDADKLRQKLGEIPEIDYVRFIQPYENVARLRELRNRQGSK